MAREQHENKSNSTTAAKSQPPMKPIPDTGWEGETPSHNGGDYEVDFLNKPPYSWTSSKFHSKYNA